MLGTMSSMATTHQTQLSKLLWERS